MGGSNRWDADLGIAQKPLMRREDWQQWIAAGMEVGSHTRTHANLTKVDAAQAQTEIKDSKTELEDTLGCEVRHFCYPYGHFTPEHRDMVAQAGYITATTTHRGRVHAGFDPLALDRIMIARACHLPLFAAKVMSRYEDRRA
jgi:peptidoglycan/xylan/chitin deacetylase (PgdA/CDA1 family)